MHAEVRTTDRHSDSITRIVFRGHYTNTSQLYVYTYIVCRVEYDTKWRRIHLTFDIK
jgi:hypothetical protein